MGAQASQAAMESGGGLPLVVPSRRAQGMGELGSGLARRPKHVFLRIWGSQGCLDEELHTFAGGLDLR